MIPALPPYGEALLAAGVAVVLIGIGTAWLLRHGNSSFGRIASRGSRADAASGSCPDDLWKAILDGLPDPVVVRDEDGRTVGANRAFVELSAGAGPNGRAAARLVDEPIETRDGTRWFSWAETTLEIDECRLRLRSGREVTDRVETVRLIEEARRKAENGSEAKSRFLATVSHEFRTPLNGILGMTGLLLDTRLDPEQTTYVNAVRSSAEAFVRLIEDILDFSKIEAGRIELSDEAFDLVALVQGVVELLAPRAQGKGTEIACFIGRDVPRTVRGDADRLRQVLINLAGNAVKFTAAGGVGIAVERGIGDNIRFTVSDTGPGIAPDKAERIFEDFEQGVLPAGSERGTGLGLAITRRLVERMKGTIGLDSEVGAGSRFTVELDLPATRDEAVEMPFLGLRRVLILSGSPFEGPFLARTLREAGTASLVARTLDEALGLLAEGGFDALIADHGLPDADVRVASREARRRGIERRIVLLSPFERRDFGSPHAAGFDAYLIKPVRARSLFERLSARIPDGQPDAERRPPPARPARKRAARVLLAEDNEVNALLAVRTLERLGALVEWARDGQEALTLAERALAGDAPPFDLVLMDVRMPVLDGYEVTRRIREREAAAGSATGLRIIALTASLGEDGAESVKAGGFDGLVLKPFAFEALAAELNRTDGAVAMAS